MVYLMVLSALYGCMPFPLLAWQYCSIEHVYKSRLLCVLVRLSLLSLTVCPALCCRAAAYLTDHYLWQQGVPTVHHQTVRAHDYMLQESQAVRS
jgi:hypothetical protein